MHVIDIVVSRMYRKHVPNDPFKWQQVLKSKKTYTHCVLKRRSTVKAVSTIRHFSFERLCYPVDDVSIVFCNWRLQDRCLRIATYYNRVMHMKERAHKTKRWSTLKKRFQRWAASWMKQERKETTETTEREERQNEHDAERRRRGSLPSASTRMERKQQDIYRSGTRRYRPRTAQNLVNKQLLNRKRRRIAVGAEVGPRLYDNILIIADRCKRARRRQGDG